MKNQFLTAESLEAFLKSLNCTNCDYFKKSHCTHSNSAANEKQKMELAKTYKEMYDNSIKRKPISLTEARRKMLDGFKHRSENISKYFSCDYFSRK